MNKPATANPVFSEVLQHIQHARHKIFTQANTALIDLYWHIGLTISHKVQSEAWGKGVVTELARYIAQNAPDIKGFSDKNLWRMKQFYETYQADEKLATLWRELSWSHNRLIMTLKTKEERAFYLHLAVQERLSVRELERQIDSAYFERSLLSAKLSPLARELHPDIQQTFKDQYVLEFLGLPETHSENDLQSALIQHMKAFILELRSIPHPASPLPGGGVNRNQFHPLTRGRLGWG
jgi:predicted nuclease of restriction endonuclease-like (RecB) superfamily